MKKQYNPNMHSAEHILNQTMERMYRCGRCFNAHIERKKSKCDYYFKKALTAGEIEEIQARVNQVIQADLPVREQFMTIKEAMHRFNTEKLPDNVGDRIRIVSIGDYDHCPCIGPHVKSTAEIGRFIITSCDFQEGILRIRYRLAN